MQTHLSGKLRHIDLNQKKQWLSEAQRAALLTIISESFAGVTANDYLQKYFYADTVFARRLRLYYSEETLIGYCLLTFSQQIIDHKKVVIVGASAAFLPKFRQGGLTFSFSIQTLLKYWLTHPRQRIYYADTMLSPAMYRAMARHIAEVWPGDCTPCRALPKIIGRLKETLKSTLESGSAAPPASQLAEDIEDFRIWVDRKTNYSLSEINQFKNSQKSEIKTYCRFNPDFDKGYALLVIIPIGLTQFLRTLKRWVFDRK